MKLKFLDNKEYDNFKLNVLNSNIIELKDIQETNLSGFQIYTDNDDLLGDYADFTTLYKQEENGYILSNDGSVYVEPEPIPPYEPTLEEIKERKLSEISNQCRQTIYKGTDVIFPSGTEHFSLTVQDQLNLLNRKNQLRDGETQIEYHSDGQLSRYYTVDEMKNIIETTDNFILYQTSYCNSLMSWIKGLEDKEQIEKIQYGDIIPKKEQSKPLVELLKL